eukprot:jgi/Hompol1/1514/HPOL_003950-RA
MPAVQETLSADSVEPQSSDEAVDSAAKDGDDAMDVDIDPVQTVTAAAETDAQPDKEQSNAMAPPTATATVPPEASLQEPVALTATSSSGGSALSLQAPRSKKASSKSAGSRRGNQPAASRSSSASWMRLLGAFRAPPDDQRYEYLVRALPFPTSTPWSPSVSTLTTVSDIDGKTPESLRTFATQSEFFVVPDSQLVPYLLHQPYLSLDTHLNRAMVCAIHRAGSWAVSSENDEDEDDPCDATQRQRIDEFTKCIRDFPVSSLLSAAQDSNERELKYQPARIDVKQVINPSLAGRLFCGRISQEVMSRKAIHPKVIQPATLNGQNGSAPVMIVNMTNELMRQGVSHGRCGQVGSVLSYYVPKRQRSQFYNGLMDDASTASIQMHIYKRVPFPTLDDLKSSLQPVELTRRASVAGTSVGSATTRTITAAQMNGSGGGVNGNHGGGSYALSDPDATRTNETDEVEETITRKQIKRFRLGAECIHVGDL